MSKYNSTFICALVCLVCDITLCISGFAEGNTMSGIGWLCAFMANLQVVILSYSDKK